MHASLRPYATAGVALVGAGVIAVTPIAPPLPSEARVASPEVTLAAASVFNIPANLINAFLNMPSTLITDMERFSAAMERSGSWNESSPGNVWGWDPENPEMLKGFFGMFVPFEPLSRPLGEHLNWWAAANLPMHEGCAYECPEIAGMLNSMFRVPPWEFWDEDGYTFGEVINPVDGQPTEWSGQNVRLDPWEPVKSVIDYLLADPVAPVFPTMYEVITAVANLASALQTTEHLPSWIAVREIETFFKYFFPAPVEETEEETEAPQTELLSVPDVTARTFTVDASLLSADLDEVSVTEAADVDEVDGAGARSDIVTDVPKDVPTVVENVIDPVTVDEIAGEPGADVTPAPDTDEDESAAPDADEEAADSETEEPKRSGGKHHKRDFSLSDAVKSVQDKFDSGKSADDDKRGADTDTADSGASDSGSGSGSDSGGGDSD